MTHLLPKAVESRRRLGEETQRLQTRAGAFRARKEVLKASYTSAHLSLLLHESTAATGTAGDSGERRQEDRDEAVSTAEAGLLRDVTAQMERELGQEAWPQGLMELRPAGPDDAGIRILFAVEPPGTVLLIAVLDGPDAVRDQYLEAILLSADMLRQVRQARHPKPPRTAMTARGASWRSSTRATPAMPAPSRPHRATHPGSAADDRNPHARKGPESDI